MTRIDIFSGFLGAGKTTLIKKLIKEAYAAERVVLIENEFGEIGIDGGFLADAGIEITEMNSGCICCSLVGDFTEALKKVMAELKPERIVIEPSGVGKLSDVLRAVKAAELEDTVINSYTAVADVNKCRMYIKNFGEFYIDQIKEARAIVLSHTDVAKPGRTEESVALIREHNPNAVIVTTPWDSLTGAEILTAIEGRDTIEGELSELEREHEHHHEHHGHDEHCDCGCHEHHHEHHEHDEHCDCGCHEHHHEHHEHDEHCDCGCHEHHHEHHEHDEHCDCGCHEHHHEHHGHDEHCDCGCHDHHHGHHHHHADEVFTSVGIETVKKFTKSELEDILNGFAESDGEGMILRAKGIVASDSGEWLHFDYVPGEADIRLGSAGIIGRICVIGTKICEKKIKECFGV